MLPRALLLPLCALSLARAQPCLPLLPPAPALLWGAQYSAPSSPAAANRTSALWGQVLGAGGRLFQLSLPWAAVEPTPGQPNIELVAQLLEEVRSVGGIPLFNLALIDTNRVTLPPDLMDPSDNTRLRAGLNFSSPEVMDRYAGLVQTLAPLVAYMGGPYWGTGNEVDVLMGEHPEYAIPFVDFTIAFQAYIKRLTAPNPLAVGATLTVAGLGQLAAAPPPWLTALLQYADVTPLTYYPLQGDFALQADSAVVHQQVLLAASALPPGRCTVFQEFGAPAGYGNASSTDGSSEALQAAFLADFMGRVPQLLAAAGHPLRAASLFEFVDMENCAAVAPQYNSTAPAFIEYLWCVGLCCALRAAAPFPPATSALKHSHQAPPHAPLPALQHAGHCQGLWRTQAGLQHLSRARQGGGGVRRAQRIALYRPILCEIPYRL